MKERLIKEARDLLPTFASMLALIVLPYVFLPAGGFGLVVLGIACVVMAGSSFGNEFQYRTFSLLLSQPIARSALWREKMLVLGAGMMAILAALRICLAARGFGYDLPEAMQEPGSHSQEKLALALIPLCAFCGAPFWTLLLRHEIGGMVFAAAGPFALLLGDAFVADRLGYSSPLAFSSTGIVLLLIYCAVAYWLGYGRFKRLEVVDGPSRELSLPASLEAYITRPLTILSSRFRGPFASLLKKELRLQQISFLLAGLFVLIALAGACLVWLHIERGGLILAGDFAIYVLVLPLIAGAVSVAEEKGWDLAEWHLTLPPSALKQWSAKMLAALSTSFVLGLVLPAILLLVGDALFAKGDALSSVPPASLVLCWVLGQLLLTSVAVYAGSFSNTTLRAILAAFAIVIAACAVCYSAPILATKFIASRITELQRPPVASPYGQYLLKTLIPLLIANCLLVILGLVHRFAWSNFRRVRPSPGSVVVQLLVVFSALGLLAFALIYVNQYQGYVLCSVLYSPAGGLWLASIVAGIIAIRWSALSVRGRFVPAIILSLLILAIACLGMRRFHLSPTIVVNGEVTWRFDSNWLFMASLVLGGFALLYTIWRKGRSRHEA